jgi:hypothetical protein
LLFPCVSVFASHFSPFPLVFLSSVPLSSVAGVSLLCKFSGLKKKKKKRTVPDVAPLAAPAAPAAPPSPADGPSTALGPTSARTHGYGVGPAAVTTPGLLLEDTGEDALRQMGLAGMEERWHLSAEALQRNVPMGAINPLACLTLVLAP